MGVTLDEVVDDYMETYVNYYGVEKESKKYEAVVNSNIINSLMKNFKLQDVSKADLAREAEEYICEDLRLSTDEVAALKLKLGTAEN